MSEGSLVGSEGQPTPCSPEQEIHLLSFWNVQRGAPRPTLLLLHSGARPVTGLQVEKIVLRETRRSLCRCPLGGLIS